MQTLEHERDFYFDKLRDIEIMCQWPAVAAQPVRRGGARRVRIDCWGFRGRWCAGSGTVCCRDWLGTWLGCLLPLFTSRQPFPCPSPTITTTPTHTIPAPRPNPRNPLCCPQVIKVIERILFAADAEEGQLVMDEAVSLYGGQDLATEPEPVSADRFQC